MGKRKSETPLMDAAVERFKKLSKPLRLLFVALVFPPIAQLLVALMVSSDVDGSGGVTFVTYTLVGGIAWGLSAARLGLPLAVVSAAWSPPVLTWFRVYAKFGSYSPGGDSQELVRGWYGWDYPPAWAAVAVLSLLAAVAGAMAGVLTRFLPDDFFEEA